MRRKTYWTPLYRQKFFKLYSIVIWFFSSWISFFRLDIGWDASGHSGASQWRKKSSKFWLEGYIQWILDTRAYLQEILYNGNIIRLCNWPITFIGDLRWPLVMITCQKHDYPFLDWFWAARICFFDNFGWLSPPMRLRVST